MSKVAYERIKSKPGNIRKIQDQRFLNLIWKLLKAGYMDLHGQKKESLIGSAPGGLINPLHANVYLHEFDEFIQGYN